MVHDRRALLRLAEDRAPEPIAVGLNCHTLNSTLESGHRSGYDGAKCEKGAKAHAAIHPLEHLLAFPLSPAAEQDRAQVETLAASVQEVIGESVELAYVDRGYTGEEAFVVAEAKGVRLEVVKHPGAK
jgi:hypothetical protein